MPNIRAAIKSLRQDKKKYERNKTRRSEIRTLIRNAKQLIENKEIEEAEKALRVVESRLDKAAKTKTIKKENASRRISRLKKQLSKARSES
jgi:small subunit ribosomal protein S20